MIYWEVVTFNYQKSLLCILRVLDMGFFIVKNTWSAQFKCMKVRHMLLNIHHQATGVYTETLMLIQCYWHQLCGNTAWSTPRTMNDRWLNSSFYSLKSWLWETIRPWRMYNLVSGCSPCWLNPTQLPSQLQWFTQPKIPEQNVHTGPLPMRYGSHTKTNCNLCYQPKLP